MNLPDRYDLLVILAGDKHARHPAAVELARRGWAHYLAVTGEHEWIDPIPELAGRILSAPPTTSTYEDAVAIRTLIQRHEFTTVLVATSAPQAERARMALTRVLAGLPVTVDIITMARATPPGSAAPSAAAVMVRLLSELAKLAYYRVRRQA